MTPVITKDAEEGGALQNPPIDWSQATGAKLHTLRNKRNTREGGVSAGIVNLAITLLSKNKNHALRMYIGYAAPKHTTIQTFHSCMTNPLNIMFLWSNERALQNVLC